MEDNDNVVENTSEMGVQDASTPVEFSQDNTEESNIEQEAQPQVAVEESKEPDQIVTSKESVAQPKSKFKSDHVPYARFVEVNRKMRELEKKLADLQGKLPTSQVQTQTPNIADQIAERMIALRQQEKREARVDESINWLKQQTEELKKNGLERSSLEDELQTIIEDSGWKVAELDPLEIIKAAYNIWYKDNVIEEVESVPPKAEVSNQDGNTDAKSSKQPAKSAADVRNEQKAKATGVSKARTSPNVQPRVETVNIDDEPDGVWSTYGTANATRANAD
jgi:hypothetical protein